MCTAPSGDGFPLGGTGQGLLIYWANRGTLPPSVERRGVLRLALFLSCSR
jgi:hypothetical protein